MEIQEKKESHCCFLIAMPQLLDPNFYQTTSLLSEFTSEGAMGIILNRPLNISISQVMGEDSKLEMAKKFQAFWGGPVQNERGFVLHEDEALASQSMKLEPGLFLSGSAEVLRELLQKKQTNPNIRFRLFLGYAGWGPGQLEKEIAQSSWITSPLDRDLLFDNSFDTLWRRSIGKLGIDPISLAQTSNTEPN